MCVNLFIIGSSLISEKQSVRTVIEIKGDKAHDDRCFVAHATTQYESWCAVVASPASTGTLVSSTLDWKKVVMVVKASISMIESGWGGRMNEMRVSVVGLMC